MPIYNAETQPSIPDFTLVSNGVFFAQNVTLQDKPYVGQKVLALGFETEQKTTGMLFIHPANVDELIKILAQTKERFK